VAPGDAHPHLALGARLPGLLLQLQHSALRRSSRPTSASAACSRLDAVRALAPLRLPPPPAPAAPARLAPSHAGMHFLSSLSRQYLDFVASSATAHTSVRVYNRN
jgi:hypothetical protein